MGVKVRPVLIKKITDRAGNVIEDNTVKPLDVVERAKRDIKKRRLRGCSQITGIETNTG